MKVRHHRGGVHTIPYGQIPSNTNYSRDWVIVKFELQVPQETDVMKLKRIVRDVSSGIAATPEFAPFILEPLKFQGIDDVDLFGLRVRLKFKAKPGEQFTLRREVLRRLINTLEENGIKLARRRVQVDSSNGKPQAGGGAIDLEDDDDDSGGGA